MSLDNNWHPLAEQLAFGIREQLFFFFLVNNN